MVQRAAVLERDADHRLLGGCRRLGDGFRHFARLAMTEANTACTVAHDDERRKAEALAALHRLGDAVDVDQLLDQLLTAIIVLVVTTIAVVAATVVAATIVIAAAATAATRTTALARCTFGRRGGVGRR